MPSQKYYPPLSDLVDARALPGEFTALENVLNEGIDLVLGKIYYKDFNVQVLQSGEARSYRITLITKTIRLPLPAGLNLVFLKGSETALTEIELAFEWRWPIAKYISNFEQQGFSYAPEAFLDILIELTDIRDRNDFFNQVIDVFLNDGDGAYQGFFTQLASAISAYDNGETDVTTLVTTITDNLDKIRQEVQVQLSTNMFTLPALFENFERNTVFKPAVEAIGTAIDTLQEDHDISVDLFGAVLKTVIGELSDIDEKFERLLRLFRKWLSDIDMEDIKKMLIPQFKIVLKDINVGLEFPRNWLVPAIPNTANPGTFIEDPVTTNLATLDFTVGTLNFSTEKGFEFENQSSFDFKEAFIGNTGIMVAFDDLKVDMSDTYNIPEADRDGRPSDFQGFFAGSASVTLPTAWFKEPDGTNARIYAKNLLVGTGGLSGKIGLEARGGDNMLWAKLGSDSGFEAGFHSFDIEFKQNKVISSNIEAAMKIASFVYPAGHANAGQTVKIGIKGHIHDDGSFNLTASTAPPYPIELQDVFVYHLSSLELGREGDGDFYIGTSGAIEFKGFLKDTLKLENIEVDRLRIYSDGSIEFEGGSIALAEPIVLPLGPVEITVTAIHYGSHQREIDGQMRKFNYFGFDGGISVDPLGIEVRGDGVKFYYCSDDLPNKPGAYLHIQTLYLDLTIPASSPAAIINGWLSIPEPGESKEYAGGIKLQLPQAKISGSADMKLMPSYPAFIIDASIDLPAPITIGPVGIYGFRGLIGYRYVAEKEAAGLVSGVNTWYEYYKAPPRGIHVQKFNGPDKTKTSGTPFSIGAGASLGTSFDNGTVLNIKAMILLSIPSLFVIDGKAALLSARLGLENTSEPPFFAFIAFGDNSLELGFGADFKMPTSTGAILKLYADVQAGFFFNDSSKWYVKIGTKENPVTAQILSFITIKAFLQLSALGIEAGARGEFDFKRQYGPIKVHAWAYIEVGGKISFERPQFGAFMSAGVGADIDIKIVSLYASFDVLFGVEASKPFKIYGEFRLCVRITILWVFKFKFCGNLSLLWEFDQQVDRTPIDPLISERNANMIPDIVQGVNMLSNETFSLAHLPGGIPAAPTTEILSTVIPLDTYIDIKTEKPLLVNLVSDLIGGLTNAPQNYTELMPPQKIIRGKEVRQVKHQYSMQSILLRSWNPQTNEWQDYHPYKALYPSEPILNSLKIGQFQKSNEQYNTIRLLATTPFSYTEQGQQGWFHPEQNGLTPGILFCENEHLRPECADFLGKPLETRYYCHDVNQLFYSNGVAFFLRNKLDGDYAEITNDANPFNVAQSLRFLNHNKLQIRLPEPSVEVKLKLTTFSHGARIHYYASLIDDNALVVPYGNPDPTAANPSQPYTETYTASELTVPVLYNHPEWMPVTRIEIEPLYPGQQQIDDLMERIAAIEHHNNLIELRVVKGEKQSTKQLEAELTKLRERGCTTVRQDPKNPCKRDDRACKLYEFVLETLFNCLDSPADYGKERGEKVFTCVNTVFENVVVYAEKNDSDCIKQQLRAIKRFLEKPEKATYAEAYKAIVALLECLYEEGNCDCTDGEITKCYTLLHSVCWLSLEKHQYNIYIPGQAAIEADTEATIAGITQFIQPIWRPDTHYVVQFTLKDTIDDIDTSPSQTYTHTYGFTTGGPVGFFHKHEKATYGDILQNDGTTLEDANGILRSASGSIIPPNPLNPLTPHPERYALTSLTRYIDYERSYPNADGNLLSAKPLFYDDETTQLNLYYSKAYATHFFNSWPSYNGLPAAAGRIKIVIKDPREGSEIVNPPRLDYEEDYTHIPQTIEHWLNDPSPVIPHVFETYAHLIEANECIPIGGNTIIPPSKYLNVVLKHLKPLKLYTAIVNNLYDLNKNGVLELPTMTPEETVEVHKYTFQTSRYASFSEQVNSYLLTDAENTVTRPAIFPLDKAFTAEEIAAALAATSEPAAANALSDSLAGTYQHRFDRVVEGIFGFPPLEKAVTTEFNVVRDLNDSSKIVALIIRNPEPFNDPKIPVDVIRDTLVVIDGSGHEVAGYHKLFSKDYSQVILMKSGGFTGPISLRFRYKLWDGTAYIVPASPHYSSDSIGTIDVVNLAIQSL